MGLAKLSIKIVNIKNSIISNTLYKYDIFSN